MAMVTTVVWFLFTFCFSEDQNACNPKFYQLNYNSRGIEQREA